MNKTILSSISLLFSILLTAQKLDSQIKYGLKAGVNNSNLGSNRMDEKYQRKFNFNAGVFVNIPISQSFNIQPELLYNGLSAEAKYNNYTNKITKTGTLKTSLSYLAIPVMFQYSIIPNFYFEAGPEFSFYLNGKNNIKINEIGYLNNDFSTDFEPYNENFNEKINKSIVNKINIGVGVGAGYFFTENIGATVRYTIGVINTFKNDYERTDVLELSTNNVLQVGLAYKF